MDKEVQSPLPLAKDNIESDGACTAPNVAPIVPDMINLTEGPLAFDHNDRIAHSSSAFATQALPSFNSMNILVNEHIKKNLPSAIKLPDLKKSKINFDGKSCVREFITEVEEYFLYKNFDEILLVGSFTDLLSGIALKWFRTVRFRIPSWRELKVALLKRFDRPDFDYFLEHDLRTRKQKSSESLPDFITDILDMASRLSSPLLDAVLVNIIKHNMLSIYTPFIFGKYIDSVEQFLVLAKELEVFVSHKSLKAEKSTVKSNAVQTCLKCKKPGHHFKHCTSIPGVICFKCQKVGVTSKNCDVCNKEDKSSGESKN